MSISSSAHVCCLSLPIMCNFVKYDGVTVAKVYVESSSTLISQRIVANATFMEAKEEGMTMIC